MDITKVIKKLQDNGMLGTEIAAAMNVSYPQLYNYRVGTQTPPEARVESLRSYLKDKIAMLSSVLEKM